MKNSEDFALRYGFYSSFRPSSVDEIEQFYRKDKGNFLEAVFLERNEHILFNFEIREKFKELISRDTDSWEFYAPRFDDWFERTKLEKRARFDKSDYEVYEDQGSGEFEDSSKESVEKLEQLEKLGEEISAINTKLDNAARGLQTVMKGAVVVALIIWVFLYVATWVDFSEVFAAIKDFVFTSIKDFLF